MTSVLITGITGFIGSHLAKALVEKGYSVHGVIKHSPTRDLKVPPLGDILDKITLTTADFTNLYSIKDVLKSVMPDYVYHLGAITPVRLSFTRPYEYLDTNYTGTVNMVHGFLELPDHQDRQFIFASTAEVYGWQSTDKPLREDVPLNPSSPYSVAKTAADMYVRMAMKVYGLNATIQRATNSYGRKSERELQYIVEDYVTRMIQNKEVYLPTPDSARQYMYVDDHVDAYVKYIEDKKSKGEVFNIAADKLVTNEELLETVKRLTSWNGKVVRGQYPGGYPYRPAVYENKVIWLDTTKIRKTLGWKPRYSLEEGLTKHIQYWKQRYNIK